MQIIKQSFQWAIIIYLLGAMAAFAETSLNIHSIDIVEDYQAGIGLPVGKIVMATGNAVIVHLNEISGYKATQDLSVYRGDTILTDRLGKVIIALLDQSQLSVGANSNLQLNKIVFQPRRLKRNSFIKMSAGKARFSVQKLKSFSEKRFRVKTTTALIGVRGSDFMIIAQTDTTEISAFENTELALTGLEMPDMPPVILNSFEKSSVLSGQMPLSPMPMSIEEIDSLKNELIIEKQITSKGASGTNTQQSETSKDQKQTIRISEHTEKAVPIQALAVDSEDLQPPMMVFTDDASRFEQERMDADQYISEQQHEIATELPDFPINP
jgi:hypothetical protein